MDIRGGYAKPKWTDVLWVQLILLPLTACRWSYFYGRWLWKFGVCRQEYGEEEKLYVIRRNMGLSQLQFDVSGISYPVKNTCAYIGQFRERISWTLVANLHAVNLAYKATMLNE